MDDELKQFMQELQDAIHESLSDSSSFATVLDKIERAGYDLSLVVEAILEVKARTEAGKNVRQDDGYDSPRQMGYSRIKLTAQDRKFLRLLKITDD